MEKIEKRVYITRCSEATLAAMYLNDEITTDEYFDETKRRNDNYKKRLKLAGGD
jgi:hypothetical protein